MTIEPVGRPVVDATGGAADGGAHRGSKVVAVAIPAYNEDRFIASVVLKARTYADRVLVVDDGSPDQTAALARAAGADVIRHATNQGKAAGINTAFRWAEENDIDALVLIDGDGQHEPSEIPALLAPVLQGAADMVIGTRFGGVESAIPAYRQVGQRALTSMTNLSSGLAVSDSQSGFRAFSRRAIQRMRFRSGGFAIESEMQFIARQEGLIVAEAPITAIYAEPAKRNPVRHGAAVVQSLVTMLERQRPLFTFGLAGLALLALGLALGLHVTTVYGATQTLAVGDSMLTILLIIVGCFIAFVGVILHSLRTLFADLREAWRPR